MWIFLMWNKLYPVLLTFEEKYLKSKQEIQVIMMQEYDSQWVDNGVKILLIW